MDRISSLPNNIIEAILKCLSLRDAVRTSILSRAWRDELSSVSQLVFDKETFPLLKDQGQKEYDKELVRVVDQVLLLHQGPISRFMLSVDLTSYPNIDRWIRYLSRHGVLELILEIWNDSRYKLPSCFFMCKEMTFLRLYQCILNPPPSFNGFNRLAVLDLQDVITSDEELGRLLSLCPLLWKLVLKYVDCNTLRISNQKLVELSVVGHQILLYLESTPLLAIASISFSGYDDQMVEDGMVPNIVNLLGNLPSIKRLELFEYTLEALSIGDVPVSLPILCALRHQSMNINFGNMQELLAAFCIFRSSFVLEKLDIDVVNFNTEGGMPADDFWQAQEEFNCNFTRLQTVEVRGFTGNCTELKFIAFFLANAPLLQIMQINFQDNVAGEANMILRHLVRLRRSSVKAEIIVPE